MPPVSLITPALRTRVLLLWRLSVITMNGLPPHQHPRTRWLQIARGRAWQPCMRLTSAGIYGFRIISVQHASRLHGPSTYLLFAQRPLISLWQNFCLPVCLVLVAWWSSTEPAISRLSYSMLRDPLNTNNALAYFVWAFGAVQPFRLRFAFVCTPAHTTAAVVHLIFVCVGRRLGVCPVRLFCIICAFVAQFRALRLSVCFVLFTRSPNCLHPPFWNVYG